MIFVFLNINLASPLTFVLCTYTHAINILDVSAALFTQTLTQGEYTQMCAMIKYFETIEIYVPSYTNAEQIHTHTTYMESTF